MQDLRAPGGVAGLQDRRVRGAGVQGGHDGRAHGLRGGLPVAAGRGELSRVQGEVGRQVPGQDVQGGLGVGPADVDPHVQAAGAQDGGVDHVLTVGGADDHHVAQGLHAVDLGQHLRDDRGLHVTGHAAAAGTEQGLHLVEEDDDRTVLGTDPAGLGEDGPDLALGLPHELAEQLGSLDVEEGGRRRPEAQ